MSASATDMFDFIDELRRRVPRDIHPMAQALIDEDIGAMRDAADDPARVLQLIAKVRERVIDELCWEAVKAETGHDFKQAYRLRRQAARFAHA